MQQNVLFIMVGGGIGSVMRYFMTLGVHTLLGKNFPYGTLSVNVLGALIIGILFSLFHHRITDASLLRSFLFVGLLGGFTTFSSFSLEAFLLIDSGEWVKFILYISSSLAFCIVAVWLGIRIGKIIF